MKAEGSPLVNGLLTAREEGWLLHVRAQPGARSNAVRGVHDGALRVSVTQAPEKGKANKAVLDVLAKALGVKRSQVQLVQGEASTAKQFLIRGVSGEEMRARLAALLTDEAAG